jgi:hypothetical protein
MWKAFREPAGREGVVPVSSPGPQGASRDRARSRQIVKRHLTVCSEQTLAYEGSLGRHADVGGDGLPGYSTRGTDA